MVGWARVILSLVVWSLVVWSPGSVRSGEAVAAPPDWPGLEPVDWSGLDWRLDRPLMINRYMYRVPPGDDSEQFYLEQAGSPGAFPALSLDAFLALPEPERQERQQWATAYRESARNIRQVINRLLDAGLTKEAYRSLPASLSEGEAQLFTRALGDLVRATAADPADPVAWFDLAYFAGCHGDDELQEKALMAFEKALARQPEDVRAALTGQRIRANLDLAWIYRDRGEGDAGLARVLAASNIMKSDETASAMESREARLIAGLIHAEMGDTGQARVLAAPLTDLYRVRRNRLAHTDVKGPEGRGSGVDSRFRQPGRGVPSAYHISVPSQKNTWEREETDWARNWVLAVAAGREGALDLALEILGPLDPLVEYPPHLNHRFWNDRGQLHEAAGQHYSARRCYALAALHRPFFLYYPLEGMRGVARSYEGATEGYTYFVGGGVFYTSGSLFSYAANCLLTWELEAGQARRDRYAHLAEKWLSACIGRNIRPARALHLRGRLRFLQDRPRQAETDLTRAQEMFQEQGESEPEVGLMLGLLAFNSGDHAGASTWLQTFTREQPDQGIGWRSLGTALTFTGQLAGAEDAFTRALELEPDNPGGWFNRALVRVKQGRREEALADLTEARRLLPENEDIGRVIQALEAGPLPDLDLSPGPVRLGPSADSARMLNRLQGDVRLDLAAEVEAGQDALWWTMDEATAAARIPELERVFRFAPSEENRLTLARVQLAAGNPKAAQRLLESRWGQQIKGGELQVLLAADRALGDTGRSVALVHGLPGTRTDFPDPQIWLLVSAICRSAGREDLGRQALELLDGPDLRP